MVIKKFKKYQDSRRHPKTAQKLKCVFKVGKVLEFFNEVLELLKLLLQRCNIAAGLEMEQ